MGLVIDEIVMVLDHNAVEKKGRVVLLVLVDPQAQLAGNDPVGLGLTPVQPDVDVPERTVRRNGIGKAQSVTFEEHHRKAVFVVECRETRDSRFVTAVAFLDLLDVESPLQQQCPRRTQLAGQHLQSIPSHRQDALHRRAAVNLAPACFVASCEKRRIFHLPVQRRPQQGEQAVGRRILHSQSFICFNIVSRP